MSEEEVNDGMQKMEEEEKRKKMFEVSEEDLEEGETFEKIERASEKKESETPIELEKGTIKNLATMFQNITTQSTTKQPFKMELDEKNEEETVESIPTEQREGVVKAADPSEWQKPIDVEKGTTKNLASKFIDAMSPPVVAKKPFKMDLEENSSSTVLENEPLVLEGVVRSSDREEEVIVSEKGRIKNMAGKFSSQPFDQKEEKPKVETSRTISQKWKERQASQDIETKPKSKVSLDTAPEFGVYENEPMERNDIARASDNKPDVIHVQHTRNLRKMWCQFEKDEISKEKEAKEVDKNIKIKKKENPVVGTEPASPLAQPDLPQEQKTKKSWSSRGKKESEKTSPPSQTETSSGFIKPTLKSVKKKI